MMSNQNDENNWLYDATICQICTETIDLTEEDTYWEAEVVELYCVYNDKPGRRFVTRVCKECLELEDAH